MPAIDDENITWTNPNLKDRAYFAAWFSNVYTMMYLNITNPKTRNYNTRFEYLNSTNGAKFPINQGAEFAGFQASYDRLVLQGQYGAFMVRTNPTLYNPH